jgi:hypothetical protein
VDGVVRVPCPSCHVVRGGGFHRRRRRSCLCEAAVSDVTIPLTGSAGLRPAWPRRALAIARAGVAVVAVAAPGDGSACPSVPADRAISGAAGAGVFRGRDAGGRLEQRLGPASGRTVRFVMGRPGRMSPGLVMAGTGGRAGPEGCWLAWTTTALSRSGTCGGATAARVAGALIFRPETVLDTLNRFCKQGVNRGRLGAAPPP